MPIFDWGRREAQVQISRAVADELTAAYQRTVQEAFREVSDALVGRQRCWRYVRPSSSRWAVGCRKYHPPRRVAEATLSAMNQAQRTYGPDLHTLVIALACAGSVDCGAPVPTVTVHRPCAHRSSRSTCRLHAS
ncbi:hypothetical protein [Sphingomonas sp. ID1715]|uniref:hypothetical protein n=1 Tax=Sphingomonas sp. ID1715 TaxID=1656898 RepID=UPI0020C2D800|nr:hypothetical protein [Sphingomonas sp. ID1715]